MEDEFRPIEVLHRHYGHLEKHLQSQKEFAWRMIMHGEETQRRGESIVEEGKKMLAEVLEMERLGSRAFMAAYCNPR
ncbi:hypothetical protein K439DRAFT_1643506 [Ramaria rubella]|nr:hypothetical protein K439DRAFT_1643506 [Ramaria rubella]